MEELDERQVARLGAEVFLEDLKHERLEQERVVDRDHLDLHSHAGVRHQPAYTEPRRLSTKSTFGLRYQHGWPRRVIESSMMSSATRKNA